MKPLTGQCALITGASKGIGREVALALAGAGMSVVLLARDRERLAEVTEECARLGVQATEVSADVTSPDHVRAAVSVLGRIDLLVNNAGVVDSHEVPLWEADWDQWWRTYETNVRGTFNVCRAVLPGMVARRAGRVVNINSVLAVRPDVRYSAYCTSKRALLGFSDALAGPLAEHGVSVFELSPGMVRTGMTLGMSICDGREDWTPVDRITGALLRVATGELDPLAGRFVHVGMDDLDQMLSRADELRAHDARRLRLTAYGPGDPLADLGTG
ncbi:SDR family NAD(P)-dependent oxidoreductase [Nonomuraea sp. NPDC047897]|uniref:SDR family NAD(P)-dependent oxidoreductase n=1 Tax=Nonomuraea sp. NPDC047897 TaxID=3364346 RepID=UPI0037218473